MAYARLMCKATKIERLKTALDEEKQKSIEISRDGKGAQKYTLKQKYRHLCMNLCNCIPNCCRKYCYFPENSCLYKTIYKARRDGTCENFTIKSVIGFIGGFFLTYIFFMFFIFQLNFKLSTATIMCSIFGSILTIGLAFSYKVRCVVFLLLPQFFSKRGRQALIAYAFILAITGPAKNILHNVGILSESMACGQEQLKEAVKQILEVIKQPFYAVRDAIKSIVKTVKVIVKQIKEVLLTIKRIVMAIVKVIKAAFQFLGKILSICNKELGTPFERCSKVFEDAVVDCNAKLGPLFNWLCSLTYVVQGVCYIVKIFDYICLLVEFVSDSVVGVVIRKVKIFVRHIRTMFYVRIKFSHSFHFETNQSKSINEITTGIVTEIRHRTERLLTVFDIMSCATSLFFIFIILKALHYRYKFLTIDRFDNRYITEDFRKIDMVRAQQEKETVLPLNHRERAMYISLSSTRLVKAERVKLFKTSVMLGITTLKLSTHMMIDYALYWIMTLIRHNSRYQTNVPAPNAVQVHITGGGFLANLLKSIVKAFQPLGVQLEIDTVPCLPDPIPPDYDRYIQIASLMLICWILTIFEPYGLRLRHSIMSYYHPTRARQRSIWLYNHILRSRSSFLKFARRQLKRKFSKSNKITKITCMEYVRANIRPKCLLICLGSDNQSSCMLCGEVFRESDTNKPIHCSNPSCPGTYCEQCFADLQNMCTICLEAIQYGDMSDISVEKDSSEDESPSKQKKKKKKQKCSSCFSKKSDDDSGNDTDTNKDSDKTPLYPEEFSETEHSSADSKTSNGDTTDNSYTYQKQKDFNDKVVDPSTTSQSQSQSTDLEKQKVYDEASWNSFQKDSSKQKDDFSVKPETTTTYSSDSSIISELELANINLTSEEDTKKSGSYRQGVTYKTVNTFEIQQPISKTKVVQELFHATRESIDRSSVTLTSTSSVSETSFIESSKGRQKRTFPIYKKEIIQRAKDVCDHQVIRIPHLNLQFTSPESSSPNQNSPRSVVERFRENIKYECVNETCEKRNLPNTQASRKTPLHVGYEIYVPRYDRFVDETNEKVNKSYEKLKFKQKVDEFKDQQRKGRQEIISSKFALKSETSSSIDMSLTEQPHCSFYSSKVKDYYKQISKKQAIVETSPIASKVKDYYKQIGKKQAIAETTPIASKVKDYYKQIGKKQAIAETTPIAKEKNKFVKIMKNLFLREKTELPEPRTDFTVDDNYVNVDSPKLKDNTYSHSQNSFPSSSTYNSSVERSSKTTATTTSTSSLMGSSICHQRGGAEGEIKINTISTLDEKLEALDDYESTDSSITDLSIFFGKSKTLPNIAIAKRRSQKPSEKVLPMRYSFTKDGSQEAIRNSLPKSCNIIKERSQEASANILPRSGSIIKRRSQETSANILPKSCSVTKRRSQESSANILPQSSFAGRSQPIKVQQTNSGLAGTERHIKTSFAGEPTYRYSREPAERDQNPPVELQAYLDKAFFNSSNPVKSELNVVAAKEMQTNLSNSDVTSTCECKSNDPDYSSRSQNEDEISNAESCCNEPQVRSNSSQRQRLSSRQSPDYNRYYGQSEGYCRARPRYSSTQISTHDISEYCGCHESPTRLKKERPYTADYCGNEFPRNNECEWDEMLNLASTSARGDNLHKSQCCQENCSCNRHKVYSRPTSDEDFCSGFSGKADFPYLGYQSTEKFLDLVNELGDTLSLRNKRRVQKAIRKFETNSRQNKNLEKPVFSDDSDDLEQIKEEHLPHHQAVCRHCKKKKRSLTPQCPTKFTRISTRKERVGKNVPFEGHRRPQQEPNYSTFQTHDKTCRPKYQQNVSSTHWELDQRTGEWFKVYNDYSYEDDFYVNLPLPTLPAKQFCDCERSQRRFSRSPERHSRNAAYCRCTNCGLARERRY